MRPSSCLHPIRIYSKSLKTYINVPCGKCEACQVIKGLRRSEKVNAAFNSFRYRFFVTLTYRNETLPLARYDKDLNAYVSNDCDYNGECYHVDALSLPCLFSGEFLNDSLKIYGGIPVLLHKDIIKFKKRLRKEIYERLGYYPVLYLYACGEYGPAHYRPHWHICIGFNEKRLSGIFRECVCEAWRMYSKYSAKRDLRLIGKIDCQSVVGDGCPNYCASYLNCTTNLPPVLRDTSFRPFSTGSPTADLQLLRTNHSDIREVFRNLDISETFVGSQDFKLCTTLCSSVYQSRYFPKCAHFSSLSHYDRVALYRAYQTTFGGFGQTADGFATFYATDRAKRFYCSTNLDRLIDIYFSPADFFQRITKLKRLYYVSRRVYFNSLACGVSVDEYVTRIEDYYNRVELDKLRRFYFNVEEQMRDPYNPLKLSDLFLYYYNTSPSILYFHYYKEQFGCTQSSTLLEDLPSQKSYASLMHQISVDNTKTKKRNEDFEHRGIKRTPWIVQLSRRKQKLLQI